MEMCTLKAARSAVQNMKENFEQEIKKTLKFIIQEGFAKNVQKKS